MSVSSMAMLDGVAAVRGVAAVTAHPDLRGLPGSNVLQQLVNGAEAWALVIALLGAFIGAGLWAVASHTPQPPLRRAAGGWRR